MSLPSEISLTQKEVDPPINNWCASGHVAPISFKRNGPSSPEEPTKFFLITTNNEINGIYCEICLIIANYIAKLNKK